MAYDELIKEVQQDIFRNHALDISREEAVRAIQAVLLTLAENLHPAEAQWFLGVLPAEISQPLGNVEPAESFPAKASLGR
jgi:uncharacterized protein (DUF2267 family)